MFFELDRDGSGSIDAEELGMMLRSLGQNPTDEELKELIDSVDDGDDKDGQLQLREFLKLYTQGLDSKNKGAAGKEDVFNVFVALGVRAQHGSEAHASPRAVVPTSSSLLTTKAPVLLFAQGDPLDPESKVSKNSVLATIKDYYELDLDLDVLNGRGSDSISQADLENFLIAEHDVVR